MQFKQVKGLVLTLVMVVALFALVPTQKAFAICLLPDCPFYELPNFNTHDPTSPLYELPNFNTHDPTSPLYELPNFNTHDPASPLYELPNFDTHDPTSPLYELPSFDPMGTYDLGFDY